MQPVLKDKKFSIEEFILFEESSEVRHEFINGSLYEMSGALDIHNLICQNLLHLFSERIAAKRFYHLYEKYEVKMPDEPIYFYPDIVITNKARSNETRYIQFHRNFLLK